MTSPRGVPPICAPRFSHACNEPQTARHFTSSQLSRYPGAGPNAPHPPVNGRPSQLLPIGVLMAISDDSTFSRAMRGINEAVLTVHLFAAPRGSEMEKRVLSSQASPFWCRRDGRCADDQVTTWNALGAQAAVMAGQTVAWSRTLAIEQIAVHDALNAIDPRYQRYVFQASALPGASADAAVAPPPMTRWSGRMQRALGPRLRDPGPSGSGRLLHAKYSEALAVIPTVLPKRMVPDGVVCRRSNPGAEEHPLRRHPVGTHPARARRLAAHTEPCPG